MNTLPQVLEEDADKETLKLYEEIKIETESPVVNYIWRHLATIDGAAHWAWQLVKLNNNRDLSNHISTLADNSARKIVKAEGIYREIPLKDDAKKIIEIYNKNNIENLVRVMMLLSILQDIGSESVKCEPVRQGTGEDGAKKTQIPQIPQIPRYDSLGAAEKEVVDTLSVTGPSGGNGIIPTLWIHLTSQHGLLEELKNPIVNVLSSAVLKNEYVFLREVTVKEVKSQKIYIPTIDKKFDVHKAYDGLMRFSQTIAELSLAGRVISHLSRKD